MREAQGRFRGISQGARQVQRLHIQLLGAPGNTPTDNNASERGIRKLKIKQKVFGTFRYNKGDDVYAIHSVANTAWKNGQF